MEAPCMKTLKGDQLAVCSCISTLPIHLLMEILCRLPIKLLKACKCVCKSWLNLISANSDFAKLHYQRSPATELLFRSAGHELVSTMLYMGNIQFHDISVSSVNLSLLFDLPRFRVRSCNSISYGDTNPKHLLFVNSCNGLVCFTHYFSSEPYAVICNPITGEFITVPARRIDRNKVRHHDYGLGFSGKENRYKLLRLNQQTVVDPVTKMKSSKQFAEICTFESGSFWKNIAHCPYSIRRRTSWSHFVFCEGRLHFDCVGSRGSDLVIACFDFENEFFEALPLPPLLVHIVKHEMNIGVLGGRLSFSCFGHGYYNRIESVDVWVMKEYGVQASWTKVFSVANNIGPCHNLSLEYTPLTHLDTGETLMLRLDNLLVSYNPILNSIRIIGRGKIQLEAYAYCPTLLLLKDALMGYNACIHNAKPRNPPQFPVGSKDAENPPWWTADVEEGIRYNRLMGRSRLYDG